MNPTYLGVKLFLLCGIIFLVASLFPRPAAPSIDFMCTPPISWLEELLFCGWPP